MQKKYQNRLQPLSEALDEPGHLDITSQLEANWLAGAIKGRYVPLNLV